MIESISSPAEPVKKQIWGPWATAGLGLVIGVIFLITQSLVVIPFTIAKLIKDTDLSLSQLTAQLLNDGNLISVATIASAVVCVGLILIIVKVRHGATIAEYLGLKPISKKTFIVMLAITIGFIIISSAVNYFLRRPLDSDFMTDAYRSVTSPPLFWIAIVIFAPIFEEIFIRGFLFIGFRQSWIGPAGAIILTTLIWAPLHIQYGLFQIAIIFVLGIVLGIVRHKTGSLLSPLIIHTFNNLLAMVMMSLY
jgi:membrane protease YdiL (CAAX protease family)